MATIAKEKNRTFPTWQAAFLALLPAIRRHAQIALRDLNTEAREEAVQEVVCNSLIAFRRLVHLGKADLAYPSVLAGYAVAQVRSGRFVGGRLNGRDVLSRYAQRKQGFHVDRLDHYNSEEKTWLEVLVEDQTAGPADIAASRIDVGNWLDRLPSRRRRVAESLASGESTAATAKRFHVTAGRISQLRRELADSWAEFQGEFLNNRANP